MSIDVRFFWAVVVALSAALLLFTLFVLGGPATRPVWRENGVVETLSALFYLSGFLLCVFFALKVPLPHRFFLIGWAALCLVFFGEETSWMQHWIGYATPGWMAANNAQGEFNLHNLAPLQGGALMTSGFNGRLLLKSQHLFQAGFVAYFLLLPLSNAVPPAGRLIARLQLPVPGRNLIVAIWTVVAFSVMLTVLSDEQTRSAIAETREMIYALSILAFVGAYIWQVRRQTRLS